MFMNAAIIQSFEQAPVWGDFREPEPAPGEQVVRVLAAALSNLVRGQASGRHYSASGETPFIPGWDGVGITSSGQRVYFFGPRAPWGAMAELSLAASTRTILVPDALDDITAAALGNPGLASWGALLGRAKLQAGETVLIHGATGVAGQQAVQAARRIGAAQVIATGRDEIGLERLKTIGADRTISLNQSKDTLVRAFGQEWNRLDVVIDYVWGPSAEALLESARGSGAAEGERRVRYVQVGSISGNPIQLKAEWLRSSGIELFGSGLGSLSAPEIVAAITRMFNSAADSSGLEIVTDAVPLRDIQAVWSRTESGRRIVFLV